MKPEELRIGNWVYFRKHLVQITEIDGDPNDPNVMFKPRTHDVESCVLTKDSDGLYYINPIPLTEEWLLKFGFENNDWTDKGKTIYHGYAKDGFMLEGHIQNLALDGGHFDKIIEHVHQLQNLYYALTGEQLKTK